MRRLVLLSLVLASSAAFTVPSFAARAQDPATKQEPAKEAPKPIERLTAWPKPADKDQVMTDIERVCKAHVPEMAEQGRAGLVGAGGSCVPFVLERYGREKDEEAHKRLFDVLVATTTAEHTRLLRREIGLLEIQHRGLPHLSWLLAALGDLDLDRGWIDSRGCHSLLGELDAAWACGSESEAAVGGLGGAR